MSVSVLTQHNDAGRLGTNLQETVLNTSNVNVNQFEKLFVHDVVGQNYAQPLSVPVVRIIVDGMDKTLQEEHVLPAELVVHMSRYLNNFIEQDPRRIKQRVILIFGLKHFDYATVTLIGIELIRQIKKKQCDVSALCPAHIQTPQVREAVLTA